MPDRLLKRALKVLVVTDRKRDGASIRKALRKGRSRSVKVTVVGTLAATLEHLDSADVDLVLLDLAMSDAGGIDAVRRIRRRAPKLPLVVITDREAERLGIKALQRDAQDYLFRDQLGPGALTRAVRYALEPDSWQGQYRRLLGINPDGVLIADTAEGRVLFVNAAAAKLLGEAPARMSELPTAFRVESSGPLDILLNSGRVVEVREVDTLWLKQPARMITMRDITDRRAMERQLSETTKRLQAANERLEQIAGTDPLTQLLNRRGIEEVLDVEIARMSRSGDRLVAILVDCDDFKHINDSYGHGVGDAALAAFARSVEGTVRAQDRVARVGGDEFLVLLPETTVAEGLVVAEKIRRAIKATVLPLANHERIPLSASLGVATVARQTVSVEEVVASLHASLQRSKRSGKDRVSGGTQAASPSSEPGARIPLDPSSIVLGFVVQEIQSLAEGRSVGCEALTRGPPGELASPTELFRTAVEQNVLTPLDLRALRGSLESFASGSKRGWYHVNLFPSTLLNTPVHRIVSLLEASGAKSDLCIELSEQQFLGDPMYLRPRTRELQKAGFRIAIDDVGFGRSSVEALMLLDPDVVKIDKRCIESIVEKPGDRRQLERLLAMLRAVDATVIVEGVETEEQLGVLKELGVPYAQGFLWGMPSEAASAVQPEGEAAYPA